jgi:predicted acylesterase/phospholipase RssA
LVTAERAVVQAEQWAQSILSGADVSAVDLRRLAGELRAAGRTDCVAELLVQVARRALEGSWRPGERAQLAADVLRDHEQFAYARRLLAQVRREGPDDEVLRQQHALCTYKDQGLPAGRRLDRAWRILESGGPLDQSTNAETLAIAGAIAKRRFEVDARREDLEIALVCYRRGFHQEGQQERWYAGLNAAFVADRLAALQDPVLGDAETATALRLEARTIRTAIVDGLVGGDEGWNDATLGEALFGLGRYDAARDSFAAVARGTSERWRQETTLMQLATIAHLHGVADDPGAQRALGALVGGSPGAVQRAWVGKVGVALSGGGFRASLFHIGVLARLAECNLLRRVEVLSCVSGGSIVGAFYYLKLRRLLQERPDGEITDRDYVCLVRELADQFLDGVRENLRGRLPMDLTDDVRMVLTKYSRTDRAGELFEELFYSRLRDQPAPWRMPDLPVRPAGSGGGFTLRYENWMRQAKVPVLVLNATTLNTGHSWQFTPTWMGEPPSPLDVRMDASRRLRRVDYRDAPAVGDLQGPTLGKAVAASACVPGLFPPITLRRLYDGIDVELVDGGVHDNQGVASLLEQDCTVLLVSDASGQLRDDEDPKRGLLGVATRANSVLMKRVRGAQYDDLLSRVRVGTLRAVMGVHLTQGLPAPPRDWSGCREPWTPDEDELAAASDEPSGIDARVQLALAQLRTDLDAFSDDEAYGLMAAGYHLTRRSLSRSLPQLAAADPALELEDWPFTSRLAEMTGPDASRLLAALRFGDARFFRGARSWVQRQRDRLPFVGAAR